MTTVERTIDRPRDVVFAALADPWTYPDWLVGAKKMRDVDAGWPAPGTEFHHRVGLVGPLTIPDSSTCLEIEAPARLVLEVRARPAGRGKVTFELVADGPERTTVRFREVPIGAVRFLGPVIAPLTSMRNTRSLDQLAELLERDVAPPA